MELNFRPLRADEIEVRINQIREREDGYYAQCLLYKDARCDQKILDETVGPMNWQRRHADHHNNLFCMIGIWDAEKQDWIWKEDAGAESNMEAEKGHASDSFKRAGTNWGIGRELYTKLYIYIRLQKNEYKIISNKPKSDAKFSVSSVETENGQIKHITIVANKGNVRWTDTEKNVNPIGYETPPKSPKTSPSDEESLKCAECGAKINPSIHDYSCKTFGRPLCIACQKRTKK